MDSSLEEMEDSSNELDIAKDINGCIQSLDDDIGPNYNAVSASINDGTTKSTNSSRSSSTSSTSSSSSGSSSSSSSSASSIAKKTPPAVVVVPKVQVDTKQKSEFYTKKPIQAPLKSLELSQLVPERVLYPAKLARKPLELSPADPHWMRNDIHQKFSKPKISSTGNTPAAHRKSRSRSKVRGKCESGYKTDNSISSNKSGYRSDHSMAAHQRRRRKSRAPSRDPSTSRNYPQAAPGDIDDLAKLMGLHLDTNESTSSTKYNIDLKKNDTNNNQNQRQRKPLATSYLGYTSGAENLNRQLLDRKIALTSKSAFHNAIKSGASFLELARQSKTMQEWSLDDTTVLPIKAPKSLGRGISIKSRRMSTQSRTGSVRSASSNISRLRRGTQNPQHSAWIEAEIGNLNGSFKKMTIAPARYHHQDVKSKRQNKKKKMSDAHLAMSTPTTKRRTKKLEPEDHKLPLKKRTYLLADGASVNDVKSKKTTDKRRRVEAITVKVPTKTVAKQNRPTKSKNIPPAGIFEPSSSLIDAQLQLAIVDDLLISTPIARGGVVDNLLNKTGAGEVIEVLKRKKRRVNRTGFPNKKRPKKKVVVLAEQQPKVPPINHVKITKLMEQEMKLTPRQLTLRQIKEQKEEEIQPLIIERKRRKTITAPEIIPLRPRRNTVYQEPLPIVPEPVLQPPPQKKLKTIQQRRLTVFQEHMPVIDQHPVTITKRQRARRKTICDDHKHKMPKIELTTSKVEVDQHPVTIIAKNKYQPGVEKKAYQESLIAGKCDCKKLKNECDEQCHNRSMCIECDVKICGKDCTNTAITTNRLVKGVEKYLTPQKGWGVRTTDNIYKKQLILEYTGEVMIKEIFKERMQTIYKDDRHHYCLEIGNNIVIDGHRMGSLCRFVNHSCKPNCKMAKVQVDGLPRMVLQADMDIPAGTELTYDYKFLDFESSEPQTCYCGEDICRGTLSAPQRRGSFTVKDGEPSGRKGGGRKAKGRILKQCPLKVSCFLNRNLRRIERINPELLAMYKNMLDNLDDDPKAGFVFFAKQRDVQSVIGSPSQTPDVIEMMEPLVILEELPETTEIQEAALSTTEQTQFLLSICNQLLETKDEAGKHCHKLIAIPQKSLAQTDEATNHDRISNPMCFDAIIKAVKTGVYDDRPHVFNYNIKILLDNCVKFYGVNCPQFRAMKLLKEKLTAIKKAIKDELKRLWIDDFMTDDFLDIKRPTKSRRKFPKADQEDVIQCICGMFLEEGVMVQCSTCKCWQHVDCVHADTNLADYYCEKCEPRTVDYEIMKSGELLNGNQCYLTLMRGDTLQVRVGDAIYVLLDIKIKDEAGNEDQSHTYKTIGNVSYDRCDIVRVDSLFKDADGKSFVVGHHYIRPHEVFHEPTRKFYNNELMRGTAFETIPIEMVIDTCWVLDTSTYFKGRPLNSDEKHVYVAEFKVDKGCKQFTTIKSKSRQPVCTKNYAFYKYEEQLKQKRTAMPHKIEDIPKKPKKELVKKGGPGRPLKGGLRFQKMDSRRSAIKQKLLRLESSVYRLKQNVPSTSTAECSGVGGRFDITQFRESYLDWLPEPMMRLVRDVRSQTPGKRSFRRSQTPMKPVELIDEKILKVIKDKKRPEILEIKKKSRSRTPVKIVKKTPPEKQLEVPKTILVVPEKIPKIIIKDEVEVEPLKQIKKKIKIIREKIIADRTMMDDNIDLETMITPSRIEKIDKKHKITEKNLPEVPMKKKKITIESQIKDISGITLEVNFRVDKSLKVPLEVYKSRSSERTRLQPLRTKSKSPSAVKEKKESSSLSVISKIEESVKKDSNKSVKKDHKEVVKSHSNSDKSYKDPRSSKKSSDRHERESPSGDRKSRSRKQKSHDRNSKGHDKERSREVVKESSSKVSSRDSKKTSVYHSKDAKEVKGDSKDVKVSKDVSKSSKESSSKKSSKEVSKDSKSKDSRESKDVKDSKDKSKDVKSSKEKESKDSKSSKDSKNSKNIKDSKDSKSKDSKSSKDNKVVKDVKESKDSRESKEPKEIKESKEVKVVKDVKEVKDNKAVVKQDSTKEVLHDKGAVKVTNEEVLVKSKESVVITVEKSEKLPETSSIQPATTSEPTKESSSIVDKSEKPPIQQTQRATRSRTPGRTKETPTTSTNITTSL